MHSPLHKASSDVFLFVFFTAFFAVIVAHLG